MKICLGGFMNNIDIEETIELINEIISEILKAMDYIYCEPKDYEEHIPVLNIFGKKIELQMSDVYRNLKKRKGFEQMYHDAAKQVFQK